MMLMVSLVMFGFVPVVDGTYILYLLLGFYARFDRAGLGDFKPVL